MDLSKSYEFFQPEKYTDRIHIVGCGSVGSTVAENLARSGVVNMTLWDFDTVEAHNLANQMFRFADVGRPKVEALADILSEINPDIEKTLTLKPKGWNGESMSGFIFLCVDNIELRQKIVKAHMENMYVKAVFDFRTGLKDAQHYAADWSDRKSRQNLLASMDFTHAEAKEATPVSACNVELSVCPTVRTVCALGVANFMNFWNTGDLKKMILINAYDFFMDAF